MGKKESELVLCEINFERIPSIKEAIQEKMFLTACWWEILIWFPALWSAGRLAHVYFAFDGVPYHVSNMPTSQLRHDYNTQKRYSHTFKVRVDKANLLKAMVMVDDANANYWRHGWCNCCSTISVLIYGHDKAYGLFGTRFGWFTRRVLRDVERLHAAQR